MFMNRDCDSWKYLATLPPRGIMRPSDRTACWGCRPRISAEHLPPLRRRPPPLTGKVSLQQSRPLRRLFCFCSCLQGSSLRAFWPWPFAAGALLFSGVAQTVERRVHTPTVADSIAATATRNPAPSPRGTAIHVRRLCCTRAGPSAYPWETVRTASAPGIAPSSLGTPGACPALPQLKESPWHQVRSSSQTSRS